MSEEKSWYLCGGVLFFLLANATPDKTTAKDHKMGIKESHKDSVVMSDLISVLTMTDSSVSGKDTSQYRECESEGSAGLPFEKPVVVSEFIRTVHSNYSAVLRRMCAFAEKHIAKQKQTWLVRALLEIIEKDSEITESDFFFARANGTMMTTDELKTESRFLLEPFLLGVFCFIVQNRKGKNHYGKGTLNLIGTKIPDKERKLKPGLGDAITRTISVDRCGLLDEVVTEGKGPNIESGDSADNIDENERIAEEPQIADSVPSADGKTVVIHQTNIIQNGPNNSSHTNYGPVTFYWGGEKK